MGSHAEHGNQHTNDRETGLYTNVFSLLCHAEQGSLSKSQTASYTRSLILLCKRHVILRSVAVPAKAGKDLFEVQRAPRRNRCLKASLSINDRSFLTFSRQDDKSSTLHSHSKEPVSDRYPNRSESVFQNHLVLLHFATQFLHSRLLGCV